MQARYVAQLDPGTLTADSPVWSESVAEVVALLGTPVGLQPTEVIRTAWLTKAIGAVSEVQASAVHDGRTLAFRLEWADATENRELGDTTAFIDGAGVLLPGAPGAAGAGGAPAAPLMTMGAPTLPVNAWYWRADEDGEGRQVVAEGVGTTRPAGPDQVRGRGVWRAGRWHVVISRAMTVENAEPVAQIKIGEKTAFGVAVWEGSVGERAGIKAFSGDWRELVLEGVATARK